MLNAKSVQSTVRFTVCDQQGRGNYFEVGGGGGKRLPGSKVTPTQN